MVEEEKQSYGYGKRPLWQWITLYLVIGILVYGLVYYFVFAKKGGYSYTQPANQYAAQPTAAPATPVANATSSGNLYLVKTDSVKGNYLTDLAGQTLYVFDKDTAGTSNCYDLCAKTWPPYTSGATSQTNLPANVTLVKRTDGISQFAWKSLPLYYYALDQKAGDTNGDDVGGIWHLVKP